MRILGFISALALCFLFVDQIKANKEESVESVEYYDDETPEESLHPQPSQHDEVRSQQTNEYKPSGTPHRDDSIEGGDPLMARPKEDPLQKLLPFITFDCVGRVEGYYADLHFGCEVFHYCKKEGKRFSFICPPNSTFNQRLMICDYDKVAKETCLEAPRYFHLNKQLYGVKKNYKFPELATSESQTVEKVVPLEMTTPLSVERRSDPTTTVTSVTQQPEKSPSSTEKPTTPTPKRAKIRTKLVRPSTTPRPPPTPTPQTEGNPVKKISRKRKPRPSPTRQPSPIEATTQYKEATDETPRLGFRKKNRPLRLRTTPSPPIPLVQPAPPEHLSNPPMTRPTRPRDQFRGPTAPQFVGQKPSKKNRKKIRPQFEEINNEVPEYERMFTAEQPRETFNSQSVPSFGGDLQSKVHSSPQTPQRPLQTPQHPQHRIQQQNMQHIAPQLPQHVAEQQQQQQQNTPQQGIQHIVHPIQQYEYQSPQKTPLQFTSERMHFSPPQKESTFAEFDPGRQNGPPGVVDTHYYRTPGTVPQYGTSGFALASRPAQQPSKPVTQYSNFAQPNVQTGGRPSQTSQPQYEYVYQDAHQGGSFTDGVFKPVSTATQSYRPQSYTQTFKPAYDPSPSLYQAQQGYTTYDPSYSGLFSAASGHVPQGYYASTATGSFSGSSIFPEQHIHHINSRKRRSLEDNYEEHLNTTNDKSNIPHPRQRRQSVFSMIPNIFSRKPSRQNNPFASASNLNPTFAEVPGFYGGRFTQQLASENPFPNFGNSFSRFFTGSPQSPFAGNGGSSLRVPQMSLSSANLFSRNRPPHTINVGGPSTFTAVSLSQIPGSADLSMSTNPFFSQATLHKHGAPKTTQGNKPPQSVLGTGSGEEILPAPGTLSHTGLKPNNAALTAPQIPTGIPPQALQQSAEIVEEDDKTAISYIPMQGGKITVTLDSIEEAGASKSPAPLSFPPKHLRPTDPKEVIAQMKNSFRPHISDPAIGELTRPNDYITQVASPGVKKEPSVSNAVNDKIKSIPYPSHLARHPEKFPKFSNSVSKPQTSSPNQFSSPQFLVPQTQFSPQLDYPRGSSMRGSYFQQKPFKSASDVSRPFSGGFPETTTPTQRPIPAVRQPPPMPAHLDPNNATTKTEDKKKRTKTRKRRPKPSTSTPLPPSMIEVVTHADSGLNVHLKPKESPELTTLPTITTTSSNKRIWYGTSPQPPRYETQFPIKFNYITRSPVSQTTSTRPPSASSTPATTSGKRVYHNLVTPTSSSFEHRLPLRLDVTNAPLYKKNMFPPRVMATNVPHEMTAYAKYTTTPLPPSPPVMRTVDLSTVTTQTPVTTTTTPKPSTPTTSTTSSVFTLPPSAQTSAVTTEQPLRIFAVTETPLTTTTTTTTTPTTKSTSTEPSTTPDEIFDFFTFPTTERVHPSSPTTSPAPIFLPQTDISLNHDRHDEIIVIDTEKERENMTASASSSSISTLKPVLKVFSNRAGGTSWYKFKTMMTSTTPRPPLKMLNAVPMHDGYEKGFPFEFFTDLSLLSKTTGKPTVAATEFPQPVYKPRSANSQNENDIRKKKAVE